MSTMTSEEAHIINTFFGWAIIVVLGILGPPAIWEWIRERRKERDA